MRTNKNSNVVHIMKAAAHKKIENMSFFVLLFHNEKDEQQDKFYQIKSTKTRIDCIK